MEGNTAGPKPGEGMSAAQLIEEAKKTQAEEGQAEEEWEEEAGEDEESSPGSVHQRIEELRLMLEEAEAENWDAMESELRSSSPSIGSGDESGDEAAAGAPAPYALPTPVPLPPPAAKASPAATASPAVPASPTAMPALASPAAPLTSPPPSAGALRH